ncbi:hypothetical protein O6H91_11G064700 [Diphasiastrum complanatum]|uniref:Uncharacterized protein n=1 Tax=Diphasiastrum complanatum TaxID=34168 RepID=A0ACC2CAZ8_DIPCM|nr:hypothetical protein O6H91_11G064700 [Diphasiastrum complanatum]
MEAKDAIWIYVLLFAACAVLIYGRPFVARSKAVYAALPASFLSFQRRFLYMHFLASAGVEQLQLLFVEVVYVKFGAERKKLPTLLTIGFSSSFLFGTFLGLSTDFIGRKRTSIFCLLLHVLVAVFKQVKSYQMLYYATFILGPALSVLPCAFEAWMVAEHEKCGFTQDWLNDTFWVMSFGSAVVAIATGALANVLVEIWGFGITSPALVTAVVAGLCALLMAQSWKDTASCTQTTWIKTTSLLMNSLHDKKVLLLGWIHACLDFTIWTFWILWMPTLVADGREVNGGLTFSLLMASRMLGSTLTSYCLCGPFLTRIETYLPVVLIVSSICMAIPAYDYQEVGDLVAVFCLFQICMGIALPSLAHLRNIYIQADRRAGVMTIYRVPANIALIIIIVYGAKYRYLENSMIFTLCTCSLLSAAAGLYMLDQWRIKVPAGYAWRID